MVTVDSVEIVRDEDDMVTMNAFQQDLLIPRVIFQDFETVTPENFETWWQEQEPSIKVQLEELLVSPPAFGSHDSGLEGYAVMVPIPRRLIERSEYDLMGEILPQIKEATLMGVRELQGTERY